MSVIDKPLTQHIKPGGTALSLAEYRTVGGYQSLMKLKAMQPQDVTKLISDSGLMGRGGAGFSTDPKVSMLARWI